MTKMCKGITLKGEHCNRLVRKSSFCYQHQNIEFRQEKPEECIVCCESLKNQRKPLECGHWIHTTCVVKSSQSKCPICRREIKLPQKYMKKIDQLARKRKEEDEELDELVHNVLNNFDPYDLAVSLFGSTDTYENGEASNPYFTISFNDEDGENVYIPYRIDTDMALFLSFMDENGDMLI